MQKAFVPPKVLTMTDMETFLSKNIYLSGSENPGQIDSQMIDHFKQGRVVPDRSHFPNCFSWYWSLAVFSKPTRALWNPLNINPQLSDHYSVDHSAKNSKKSGDRFEKQPSQRPKRGFQVHCNTLDFPSGSHGQRSSSQFEASFKMSQISSNKSQSVNSNIQDCQDLVDGLRRNGSFPSLRSASETVTGRAPATRVEAKDGFSEIQSTETLEKANVQIIKAKIIPEKSTNQLRICELITSSFESTILAKAGNRTPNASCEVYSQDSTRAHVLESLSQKENKIKNEQMEIEISANYSFFHDTETHNDPKPPPGDRPLLENGCQRFPNGREQGACANTLQRSEDVRTRYPQNSEHKAQQFLSLIDWNCKVLTSDSLDHLGRSPGKKDGAEAVRKGV